MPNYYFHHFSLNMSKTQIILFTSLRLFSILLLIFSILSFDQFGQSFQFPLHCSLIHYGWEHIKRGISRQNLANCFLSILWSFKRIIPQINNFLFSFLPGESDAFAGLTMTSTFACKMSPSSTFTRKIPYNTKIEI
jgi:hypothetical protein